MADARLKRERTLGLSSETVLGECEGQDLNPRTPPGADLKSTAFGQTRPPSLTRLWMRDEKVVSVSQELLMFPLTNA